MAQAYQPKGTSASIVADLADLSVTFLARTDVYVESKALQLLIKELSWRLAKEADKDKALDLLRVWRAQLTENGPRLLAQALEAQRTYGLPRPVFTERMATNLINQCPPPPDTV